MNPLQQFIADRTPDGWQTRPFWSLFQRVKNTGYPEEELLSVYRDYGVIPKSSRDDNHNKESEDLSGYQLVDKGYLVTNKMKAWQGSIAISRYRGIVSPAYYVYKPLSTEHDDQFLHYLLRSENYIALYGRISKGVRVNQWDLEHEALRNIPVLFPSRDKQKEIADFLDRETSRIDHLIEKKQKLIHAILERERNILSEMFLCINARKWRVRHLGKIKNGAGFPVELQGDPSQEVAFFKVKHLKTHGLDSAILESEDTISQETAGALRATIFPQGTIVLAKIGAALLLGRFAMLGRSACIDNNMAAFIPNTNIINPDFALLGLSQMDMMTIVQPGTVPSLNTESFYNHKIPTPTKNEQIKFVEEFRRSRNLLRQANEKVFASIERMHEFRVSLITEAVTGQLDIHAWQKRGTGDRQLDQIERDTEQENKTKKARA